MTRRGWRIQPARLTGASAPGYITKTLMNGLLPFVFARLAPAERPDTAGILLPRTRFFWQRAKVLCHQRFLTHLCSRFQERRV